MKVPPTIRVGNVDDAPATYGRRAGRVVADHVSGSCTATTTGSPSGADDRLGAPRPQRARCGARTRWRLKSVPARSLGLPPAVAFAHLGSMRSYTRLHAERRPGARMGRRLTTEWARRAVARGLRPIARCGGNRRATSTKTPARAPVKEERWTLAGKPTLKYGTDGDLRVLAA